MSTCQSGAGAIAASPSRFSSANVVTEMHKRGIPRTAESVDHNCQDAIDTSNSEQWPSTEDEEQSAIPLLLVAGDGHSGKDLYEGQEDGRSSDACCQ